MPKENDEKTKLGRKLLTAVGLVAAVFVVGYVGYMFYQHERESEYDKKYHPAVESPVAVIGGKTFDLEMVETLAAQQKGLSGRDKLAKNTAMLFAYDEPAQRCIWMKDMRFSIDIIWLDTTERVVRIADRVSPETYPETYCVDDARFVIEMNAGQAKELGVREYDQILLHL